MSHQSLTHSRFRPGQQGLTALVISPEDRTEIIRRATIVAELFMWSMDRRRAFAQYVLFPGPEIGPAGKYLDPALFGLDEEFVAAPGFDTQMSAAEAAAYGRYQAALAVIAWRDYRATPEQAPARALSLDSEEYQGQAIYLDEFRTDVVEARFEPAQTIDELLPGYDGAVTRWLVEEEDGSLSSGAMGYSGLALRPLDWPIVLLHQSDDEPLQIMDGWHRTALAHVLGLKTLPAYINSAPAPAPDMSLR